MGWRAQEAYDRAQREHEIAWLRSLPRRERIMIRLRQTFWLLLFAAAVLVPLAKRWF